MWDYIMEHCGEFVRDSDSAFIRATCEAWGLYCAAQKAAKADPLDKDNRIAVNAYRNDWERMSRRLGLNPLDRNRFRPNEKATPQVAARKR